MTKSKRSSYGCGGVYPRKDGRWLATVPLGKDANGKRLRWCEYAATEPEAQALWRDALRKRDRGNLHEPSKLTVAQFLEHWLEMAVTHHHAPNTVELYTGMVRNHLSPALGHHRLQKLSPDHVQAMLNERARSGKSRRTLTIMRGVLANSLRFAERRGWVDRNVATLVSIPKAPTKDAPYLTLEQAHAFTQAIKGHPYEAFYWTIITCGLRLSEAMGLRWRDIDFEARTISVTHNLYRKHGKLSWVAPKTSYSKSTVILPEVLVPYLVAQRDAQEFMRRASDEWIETDTVFATHRGIPYATATVHWHTKRLMREVGVPAGNIHSLRHTYATLLLLAGVDIKTLSEAMRHANVTTTMRVYAHVLPQLKQAAADAISRLMVEKMA